MSCTLCVFAFGHVSAVRHLCVCNFNMDFMSFYDEYDVNFKMIFIMAEVIFVATRPSQLVVADRTSSFVNADIYCVIVCT